MNNGVDVGSDLWEGISGLHCRHICDNIFYFLDIRFCSDLQDICNDPKSVTHAFYVLSVVDSKTENLQVLTNHEVRR